MRTFIALLVSFFLPVSMLFAETATLSWQASSTPGVTNYKIYRFLGPCTELGPVQFLSTIGAMTQFVDATIPADAPGARYAVTSLIGTLESTAKSNEVCKSFTVPVPTVTVNAPTGFMPRVGTAKVIMTYANGMPTAVTLAGVAGNPATIAHYPTGNLSGEFVLSGNTLTFTLCLSCFPADGTYALTVTSSYRWAPQIVQTVTLKLQPAPPVAPSNLQVTQLTPNSIQIIALASACGSIKTTGSGLKRVVTCVPPL